MRISIITLTLNAEKTLEKTIRSVIDQQYPNTEFMIFDGGSTDGTVDLIKQYESHLAYWHSEIDHAPDYNIAISKITGDIICFLNADDWFEGDVLHRVAAVVSQQPDVDVISCRTQLVQKNDDDGYQCLLNLGRKELTLTIENSLRYPAINARFFHRRIIERFTPFSTYNAQGEYQYTHDKKFMLEVALSQPKTAFIDQLGHTFLKHDRSITFSGKSQVVLKCCEEHIQVAEKYLDNTIVKKWYRENTCRYVIRAICCKQFRNAFNKMKMVSKKDPIWYLSFFRTFYLIAKSQLNRLCTAH